MLSIYNANRLEPLADLLSAFMQYEPLSLFQQETVLVESAGMSQWLNTRIAQNNGIASQIVYPYPASFIWQLYRAQQPDLPRISGFDREPLTYQLLSLFESEATDWSTLTVVQSYLSGLPSLSHRFEFARYLAGLFDQYQIYRPELLLSWLSSSQVDDWQAKLWRYLHQQQPNELDRAQIFSQSLSLDLAQDHLQGMTRLQVFAISNLPMPLMNMLYRVSDLIDVNLYQISPSRSFWLDRVNHAEANIDELTPQHFLGLLAEQSRQFQVLLQQYENQESMDAFVTVKDDYLLGHIQNLILDFDETQSESTAKLAIKATDDSIIVHSCHNRLREVQVVKNQILYFLEHHRDARLDDIAIMMPDLTRYQAYFESIFDFGSQTLPFHIAERHSGATMSIQWALLQLLELKTNQFSRQSITALIKQPAIAAAFQLNDPETIQFCIDAYQVHSGYVDEDWTRLGPDVVSMSWQQCKDRILAHFAAPFDLSDPPLLYLYDDSLAALGSFIHFLDALNVIAMMPNAQSVERWIDLAEQLLNTFFHCDTYEQQQEIRVIRECLTDWQQQLAVTSCKTPLTDKLFISCLSEKFTEGGSQHFLKQGVINVATLLPMRSLPFQFIALLGMNDNEYPKPFNKDPLDWMQRQPRLGDRQKATEERYLFLEALLAARKKLHISYLGKSDIDNTDRFPSLLVSELLDFADHHFEVIGEGAAVFPIRQRLIIQHPLQAFDPFYFKPTAGQTVIQSSEKQFLLQQQNLMKYQPMPIHFGINPIETSPLALTLQQTVKALADPQAFFLSQMAIYPSHRLSIDEKQERLIADGLSQWQLLNTLLADDIKQVRFYCQRGLIPQAQLGQYYLTERNTLSKQLQAAVDEIKAKGAQRAYAINHRFELDATTCQFEGNIEHCFADHHLAYVGEKFSTLGLLGAWFNHLLLNYTQQPMQSYLITAEKKALLSPMERSKAEIYLIDLLILVQKAQSQLLPFFPYSALKFIEKMYWEKKPQAEAAFLKQLVGQGPMSGEILKPHFNYLWHGEIPDQETMFDEITNRFDMMMDHWSFFE